MGIGQCRSQTIMMMPTEATGDDNDDDDQTVGSKDEDKAFFKRKFCAFAVVSNPVEICEFFERNLDYIESY